MKLVGALLLAAFLATCGAQTTPGKLSFALPAHDGSLTLDQRGWKITEFSIKDQGTEFGIRAEDGSHEFLGFLYPATKKEGTAETCREGMLKTEGLDRSPDAVDRALIKSDSGVEIATVLIYLRAKTKLSDHVTGQTLNNSRMRARLRAFIGSGDLCGDIFFGFDLSSAEQDRAQIETFQSELRTLQFDPKAKPTFLGALIYATVAFTKLRPVPAMGAYDCALRHLDESNDPQQWRATIADQREIAYAMSMGPLKVRAALQEVISHNPDYPSPYYLLAKTDADLGEVIGARNHLQQAFDRRADSLPGEIFPDPVNDTSFVKLKSDKAFWAFVEDLSKQLKKS